MELTAKLSDQDKEDIARMTADLLRPLLLRDAKDPEEWVKVEDISEDTGYCVRTLTGRIQGRHIERKRVEGKYAIQRKHIGEILTKAS